MGLWGYGTMGLWDYGTVGLWGCGTPLSDVAPASSASVAKLDGIVSVLGVNDALELRLTGQMTKLMSDGAARLPTL